MDYLQTCDFVDKKNIAVIGHSRLGKTALLTGAFDERFAFVISNDSGCSGAAISRDKEGERIDAILTRFPFWFCKNYAKYAGKEEDLPFDQHWLMSLIAPRKLTVLTGSQDDIFPLDGVKASYQTVEKIYAKENASDRCRLVVTPKAHYWYQPDAWAASHEGAADLGWKIGV